MMTEGSATANDAAVDSSLVVSSEESVESTTLGDGDPAVSTLVEEDEYAAISRSTTKSLSVSDEMCCSWGADHAFYLYLRISSSGESHARMKALSRGFIAGNAGKTHFAISPLPDGVA